jgi:hypothetical protein
MEIDDPMFNQFREHDALVSGWFLTNNWPVTMRHFDPDREVLAWRHDGIDQIRTVRVTKSVLEDYPADKVLALFVATRLNEVLVAHPKKYVVLRERAGGAIGFDVLDGPPV